MGGRGRSNNQSKYSKMDYQREYGQFVPRQRNWQDVKQQNLIDSQSDGTNDMGLVVDNYQYNPYQVNTMLHMEQKPIIHMSGSMDQSGMMGDPNGGGHIIGEVETGILDENGKLRFNEIFKNRKKASVRAKEKKLRQNRQLRRAMLPKNALMAMNELKGLNVSEFTFNNIETGGFMATVTVNGKEHQGKGNSKAAAKNAACESVLRDFVITKMMQKPRKRKGNSTSGSVHEDMDVEEDSAKGPTLEECEELPMVNLASFALYKLFSEWEREGFIVPELHPHEFDNSQQQPNQNSTGETVTTPKKATNRAELPKDWQQLHPATLLCMMRPGLTYNEYGSTGDKANITHRIGVVVDGKEYFETGRSKKIARKNVAIQACNELFGTNFVKEEAPAAPIPTVAS